MSRTENRARNRRLRGDQSAEIIAAFAKEHGGTFRLLSAANFHYRIMNSQGGEVDFFGSTHRWYITTENCARGQGLENLAKIFPTVQARGVEGGSDQPRPEYVTIFCDGAFDHRTGAGGWGAWIKGAGDAIMEGGPLDGVLPSSAEAEMRALANGLHVAVKTGALNRHKIAMLQSDCTAVLAVLMSAIPGVKHSRAPTSAIDIYPSRRVDKWKRESQGLHFILTLVEQFKFKIVVRHIKGHSTAHGGRSWCNTQADLMARNGMRRRRQELQQEIRP